MTLLQLLAVTMMMFICTQADITDGVSSYLDEREKLVQTESRRTIGSMTDDVSKYLDEREELVRTESRRTIGSSLVLNDREKVVDDILLRAKRREVEQGMREPFPPSINFLIGKPLVERSEVFEIIRIMPKGGILHTHDVSLPSIDWIIKEVTYLPDLYLCFVSQSSRSMRFRFQSSRPRERSPDCSSDWEEVADVRNRMGAEEFDQRLYKLFTMATPNPAQDFPNNTMAWTRFGPALVALNDLYLSTMTFKKILKQGFQEMLESNVQYVEVRHQFEPMIDEDGKPTSTEYVLQQFIEAVEEFREDKPTDFFGAKFIGISLRVPKNRTRILNDIKQSMALLKKYPNHFAGYDMATNENSGGHLLYYINELLYPARNGVDLPFFFHAGETNWQGTIADMNIVDAYLLRARRIGHGYTINKHPEVFEKMREMGIAIEVNPISNQVLSLVDDLRNHVAASLIAVDFPLVISSDTSNCWGAAPLSHDYYMAFMAMSGKDVGLTLLKQLALNTFKYSAMTEEEKAGAIKLWQAKWDTFIDEIILKYGACEGARCEDL